MGSVVMRTRRLVRNFTATPGGFSIGFSFGSLRALFLTQAWLDETCRCNCSLWDTFQTTVLWLCPELSENRRRRPPWYGLLVHDDTDRQVVATYRYRFSRRSSSGLCKMKVVVAPSIRRHQRHLITRNDQYLDHFTRRRYDIIRLPLILSRFAQAGPSQTFTEKNRWRFKSSSPQRPPAPGVAPIDGLENLKV